VAAGLQFLENAVHQLHFAALGDQLLRIGQVDGAVEGGCDEVRVVAVFTHLHEYVVQRGHGRGAASTRLGGLGGRGHGLL
jgi:hypothetical protein